MKLSLITAALSSVASAHYTFPALITNGVVGADWTNVRQWTGYYTNNPVTSVSTLDIRCNVNASTATAKTLSVAAGSKLGFTAFASISHPGPMLFYMAKVPAGKTAATWDGSGSVWFKVYQDGPTFGNSLTWPTSGRLRLFWHSAGHADTSTGATQVFFNIPKSVPTGEYLVRAEHIALHTAGTVGGAQFYLSCGQISVTGGGSGVPKPLVAFPGAYSATDPGILFNLYYPTVSRIQNMSSRS